MRLEIYGSSDDLIEVEGDITEEFNHLDDKSYLAVSDGSVFRITYDGMWHIHRLMNGSSTFLHYPATDEDENYSDHVILMGDNLTWVVFGDRYEKA